MVLLDIGELNKFIEKNADNSDIIANKLKEIAEEIYNDKKVEKIYGIISNSDKNIFLIDPSLSEYGIDILKTYFKTKAIARQYVEHITDGIIETDWFIRVNKDIIIDTLKDINLYNQDNIDLLYVSENIHPDWIKNFKTYNGSEFKIHSLIRNRCEVQVILHLFIK